MIMKKLAYGILVVMALAVTFSCEKSSKKESGYEYLYENLPFEMAKIERPKFPERQLSVVECGALGDGVTLNTEFFTKAIDKLSEQGGGTLVVPSGVWLTGPIVFKSNINLHLEKGALLLFTDDLDAYPLVKATFEGQETRRCQSPISGHNLENIAITGQGAINGSGQAWRPVKKSKLTESQWKELVASGGFLFNESYWLPTEKSMKAESLVSQRYLWNTYSDEQWDSIKDYMRPVMVNFVECKNILLEGVLFENSPSWNIHPLMCENLIVDGIFVRNPAYAQNGDGLDIESCRNCIVVNTTLDVGDDAICLKSGKDEEGRRRGRPTENVIVDNCLVFKGHGGFVVGSEMSGGVRNISVSNSLFVGTDIGLRFKSNRGRGGVVENIYINNISMTNIVGESLLFDLYYGHKASAEDEPVPEVTEATPNFRNIHIKNVVSRNSKRAMFFNGLPEKHISNVYVEDCYMSARYGAVLSALDSAQFRNVKIIPTEGEPLTLYNADVEVLE